MLLSRVFQRHLLLKDPKRWSNWLSLFRLLATVGFWNKLACPWLNQMASTIPSTALSKSAESNTTTGDFPPSSNESFFPLPAVNLRSTFPTYTQLIGTRIRIKSDTMEGFMWSLRICCNKKCKKGHWKVPCCCWKVAAGSKEYNNILLLSIGRSVAMVGLCGWSNLVMFKREDVFQPGRKGQKGNWVRRQGVWRKRKVSHGNLYSIVSIPFFSSNLNENAF